MSSFMIALLAAAGAGTWLYVRLDRETGEGNSRSAAIGAAVAGIVLFIVVYSLLNLLTS